MKSIFALLLAVFSSASYASIYRCNYQLCSWDSCSSYTDIVKIEGNTFQKWMEKNDKDKVDYTDIRNADKEDIATGKIEHERLKNGNYHVVGPDLKTQWEKDLDKNDSRTMFIEIEVYASMIMGRPFGKMIETEHRHHAKNPNREIKPAITKYSCNFVK